MTLLPQIIIAAWLTITVSFAIFGALRPVAGWIVLTPRHQRIAALSLAAGALSEGSLLWTAGFFKDLF